MVAKRHCIYPRDIRLVGFVAFMLTLMFALVAAAFITSSLGCTEQQKAEAKQIELQAAHAAIDIAAAEAHAALDAKAKPATQPAN